MGSKFQFKKETNFPGNDKSDFISCYTSPSLRSSTESNVALCLQFCQPGRFLYECQTFSFMKGEINVLNNFENKNFRKSNRCIGYDQCKSSFNIEFQKATSSEYY